MFNSRTWCQEKQGRILWQHVLVEWLPDYAEIDCTTLRLKDHSTWLRRHTKWFLFGLDFCLTWHLWEAVTLHAWPWTQEPRRPHIWDICQWPGALWCLQYEAIIKSAMCLSKMMMWKVTGSTQGVSDVHKKPLRTSRLLLTLVHKEEISIWWDMP